MKTVFADDTSKRAFEAMAALIQDGRATALVGAGSSARLGYPLWGKLIELLADEVAMRDPTSRERLEGIRTLDDLEYKAQEYRTLLGDDSYRDVLKRTFSDRAPHCDDFHVDLVKLPFRHFLTTNYDCVLEHAHVRAHTSVPRCIGWWSESEVSEFIRHGAEDSFERRYFYLHGRCNAPETIILTQSDYDALYRRRADLPPMLFALLATTRLVSIGFSLSDLDLMMFFRDVKAKMAGGAPSHFAILPLDPKHEAGATRRMLNAKYGVEPVFYLPTTGHPELHDLLRQISGGNATAESPGPVALPAGGSTSAGAVSAPAVRPSAVQAMAPELRYINVLREAGAAVNDLKALGARFKMASVAARVKSLHQVMKEDLYRVAVVGKSRAGKSTLLNALVGRVICPSQFDLTTAVPIVIGPGEPERAVVGFDGREPLVLRGPITAEVLAPYADQAHNPENYLGVKHIEVELAHDVLNLGIVYVDIPGFDDATPSIWEAASREIAAAHALVVVIDISTAEHGGFAIDNRTAQLLRDARGRNRSLLIAGNKADALSDTGRARALATLERQLGRLDIAKALASPPFLLSARETTEAQRGGTLLPSAFVEFDETLWKLLWQTESIGLRRLYRVFDQLVEASGEVAALIKLREAQEPERVRLRAAVDECDAKRQQIVRRYRADVDRPRLMIDERIERISAELKRRVEAIVASALQSNSLPSKSAVIEQVKGEAVRLCRQTVTETGQRVAECMTTAERAVRVSLAELRGQVGMPQSQRALEEELAALPNWRVYTDMPVLDDIDRIMGMTGVAAGTLLVGAGLLVAVGLPAVAAVAVGGLVSSLSGLLFEVFTNRASSAARLVSKCMDKLDSHLEEIRQRVHQMVDGAEQAQLERIDEQMTSFMSDMRERLDDMRPATEEEVRLHRQLSTQVFDAAARLAAALREGGQAPVAPTPGTGGGEGSS